VTSIGFEPTVPEASATKAFFALPPQYCGLVMVLMSIQAKPTCVVVKPPVPATVFVGNHTCLLALSTHSYEAELVLKAGATENGYAVPHDTPVVKWQSSAC
jgi:hypothetical protein